MLNMISILLDLKTTDEEQGDRSKYPADAN